MEKQKDLFKPLAALNEFVTQLNPGSVHILVDENTRRHCYPKVEPLLPAHQLIQIKSGEQHKTIETCNHIWQHLTEAKADRNALLVNLGGGVIGDMGGFAAACYKRGIRFINIPTTLLAMVDASVGGKTGVDFAGFKNQVGVFCEPEMVFIDTAFLETLPGRELRSGFAEVIKHYLIADKDAIAGLEYINWPDVVARNIEIKAAIVAQDPFEKGARKALNFGHTVGHAVESYLLDTAPILHGEAVAIGILAESYISMKMDRLTGQELSGVSGLVLRYFELPKIDEQAFDQLLLLISHDKKNTAGLNQFTLLQGIGNYSVNNFVEESLIKDSFKYYNSLLA